MKINFEPKTVVNNFNPLNWDRATKKRVLYAGAVSAVAFAGLVALSNLPTAQAFPKGPIADTCKISPPGLWKYEQCSTSPELADSSTNEELFWYGARQVGNAVENTVVFVGNIIGSIISGVFQDVVSGEAAYRNCVQGGGSFCRLLNTEGNVLYEKCLRDSLSPVLCEHLK